MKLSIDGVLYDPAGYERLTLLEIIRLEKDSKEICEELDREPLKWADLKAMAERAQVQTEDEFSGTTDAIWVIGLTVYASKLRAGEAITFTEAINMEFNSIDWVREPGDPDPTQDRTGAAGPKAVPARAGSRRAPADHKKKSAPKSSRA